MPRSLYQGCFRTTASSGDDAGPERLNDSEFSIVAGYAVEHRGVVEYYRMAYNLREFGHLRWVMETSMAKTLAAKLKISVPKVYRRFGAIVPTDRGPRKVLASRSNATKARSHFSHNGATSPS